MPALLVLPESRIAEETRRAQDIAAAEASWSHAWRRRIVLLTLRCGAVYVAGGALVGASFTLAGDMAHVALWGGLLLGNTGPLALAYAFWMREQGQW